jgi:hypothetical protein
MVTFADDVSNTKAKTEPDRTPFGTVMSGISGLYGINPIADD